MAFEKIKKSFDDYKKQRTLEHQNKVYTDAKNGGSVDVYEFKEDAKLYKMIASDASSVIYRELGKVNLAKYTKMNAVNWLYDIADEFAQGNVDWNRIAKDHGIDPVSPMVRFHQRYTNYNENKLKDPSHPLYALYMETSEKDKKWQETKDTYLTKPLEKVVRESRRYGYICWIEDQTVICCTEVVPVSNVYKNQILEYLKPNTLQESGVIKLPSNLDLYKVLTEAGIEVENKTNFKLLDEANQLRVTDDALTSMMKFITDKYNSIDFSEIEKSAGSYTRFKYAGMIDENLEMLRNIYNSTPEAEAKKYIEVINACFIVREHLISNQTAYSTMYKQGNGLVQLMYTSLVAAIVYCIGTLVSNTIRFVTTEKDTDCEVLFDEIPGSIKHIHIKNILAVSADIGTFNKLLNELAKPSTRKGMNESISLAALLAVVPGGKTALLAVGAVAAVIYLAPRVLWLIREIIYSIYFTRVKVSDMLGMQADLIRTNIESLEAGRGNKKVIARQRKIADKLEKWKNKIAVKMDTVEQLKSAQTKKEDRQTRVTDDKIYSPEPNNNLLI